MSLSFSYQKYILDFKFEAGTSRGVLKAKETYFIKLSGAEKKTFGLGECGPLPGLSIDDRKDFESHLSRILNDLKKERIPSSREEIFQLADYYTGKDFPSIRFGIETALLDLINGGKRVIFENDFVEGKLKIPINGLIWMGNLEAMGRQVPKKIDAGFTCIKMKVGSLNLEKECELLRQIREKYDRALMLRVDANGAFTPYEALQKLQQLAQLDIHSIEQPIAAGQRQEMAQLCRNSPVDIALDEELIGVCTKENKRKLLQEIRPQHIILKPTLIGGIRSCLEWVEIAEDMKIGWWLTSALESNVGLNAICQLAAFLKAKGYQGLGTGQLYFNNIPSPLRIEAGHILYEQGGQWDLSYLSL